MAIYKVTIENCEIQEIEKHEAAADSPETANQEEIHFSYDKREAKAGSWRICILHDAPGRIIAEYDSKDSASPQRLYSILRDGTFMLSDFDQPRLVWLEVADIRRLMQQKFGITRIISENPNQTFRGNSCLRDGLRSTRKIFCVITDGDADITFPDDKDNVYDPDNLEDRYFYSGLVAYEVKDATWTIVCRADEEPTYGFRRTINLYSSEENLYLLIPELEEYLESEQYSDFADLLLEQENIMQS